ncbi:hypothetical protein V8D89_006800 [Ganoderma adspersum]
MVVKVYGHPISTTTQRVLLILAELAVPHELIEVRFHELEHKSPAHRAHHPFGQVPYIVDSDNGSFEVFESRAICRYLALRYGGLGTLVPPQSDVEGTARFEQAASVEVCDFQGPVGNLAWECKFKLYELRGKTNPEVAKAYKAKVEGGLDGYDAMLAKTRFLAGDELTLVDLFHLPHESFLKDQGFDLVTSESSRWPNVARWWKEIAGRPSWGKVRASCQTN